MRRSGQMREYRGVVEKMIIFLEWFGYVMPIGEDRLIRKLTCEKGRNETVAGRPLLNCWMMS